mmetsp:Transcript_16548/g.29146  ORF Transcript_16548/g.29146 Transcript_16548/m.29146 type:complete len:657 (-) Transcript_16548:65-2035(-)
MKISVFAVAAMTLQLTSGQRDEPRRVRGAVQRRLEGHAGDHTMLEAEEEDKPEKSAKKTVDFLPVYKAMEAFQSKAAGDATKSSSSTSSMPEKSTGSKPMGPDRNAATSALVDATTTPTTDVRLSNADKRSESERAKKRSEKKARKEARKEAREQATPTEEKAISGPISGPYKYESSKWEARKIKGRVSLDVDAFDEAVVAWSKNLCDLGITATLFDNNSEMVYQKSVGTMYTPFVEGGYSLTSGFGPLEEGWTGDTVFTPYSNTKGVAAATFLASVVDARLGYLDEPIHTTFIDLKDSQVGQMTSRQILSHTSGLKTFNREDPENDRYYSCKYDESKTLRECLEMFVLTDDNLNNPPGTMTGYNNEAFDILAEVAVQKTGMDNFGEIFQKYIAGPLGMDSTTYDCPIVKSTQEKPGVAWGLCSTGNDFPKFVQMLSKDGMSPSGERVLTKNAVYQMFSHGGGSALNTGDLLWGGHLPFYATRCYPRLVKGALKNMVPELGDLALPLTSVAGYGLGTMFFLGNFGEIFGHAGSTGGIWLVAPGRFAIYLTWMASSSIAPEVAGGTYTLIADILNAFENASTFTVENSLGVEDGSEQIEICGGQDMYVDLFSQLGISSFEPLTPTLKCPGDEQRLSATEVHPLSAAFDVTGFPFHLL